MNFIKAFFSWKLWLNILIGAGILAGLWILTFRWLGTYTQHNVEIEIPDLSKMSVHEATKKLDELGLTYSVDSLRYSESYEPFEVVEYYPKKGAMVKPGRKVLIKSNPRTWQPEELPNLIDKSKRIAFIQLQTRHFVVGDTIYRLDPAKDAVLEMLYNGKPVAPGTYLPRGSKIDLVLGKGFEMDVSVPDIMGLSYSEAKAVIEESTFTLGRVTFLGADKDTLSATVVYQDPPSFDTYDQGLPISIWLSTKMRSTLRRQIDSLDILYKRKMSKNDSLYLKSIERAKDIDVSDLPEDIRNQIKDAPKPKPKPKRPEQNTDPTGIIID